MTGNIFVSCPGRGIQNRSRPTVPSSTGLAKAHSLMLQLALLLALPLLSMASASAQRTLLNYNDFAQVVLLSPSETCLENGEDEHCLLLQKLDGSAWSGLEYPIEELSLPTSSEEKIVAGRHGDDFGWFVYDFSLEDYIDSPLEQYEVLDIYASLGLSPPEFIDATDARSVFRVSSRGESGFGNIVLAIVGVLTAVALLLFFILALALWLLGKRLTARRRSDLRRALWIFAVVAAFGWIVLLLIVVLWSGT